MRASGYSGSHYNLHRQERENDKNIKRATRNLFQDSTTEESSVDENNKCV